MQEPMKQRFKKKCRDTYYARGIVFADDITYWSRDGRYAKRMIRGKPHNHDYGRKPRWRAFRKILRKFKREVRTFEPRQKLHTRGVLYARQFRQM